MRSELRIAFGVIGALVVIFTIASLVLQPDLFDLSDSTGPGWRGIAFLVSGVAVGVATVVQGVVALAAWIAARRVAHVPLPDVLLRDKQRHTEMNAAQGPHPPAKVSLFRADPNVGIAAESQKAIADRLREAGLREEAMQAYLLAGRIAAENADFAETFISLVAARNLAEEIADTQGRREAYLALANLYISTRLYPEAEARARRILQGRGRSSHKAEALRVLASVAWYQPELDVLRPSGSSPRPITERNRRQELRKAVLAAIHAFQKTAEEYEALAVNTRRHQGTDDLMCGEIRTLYGKASDAWGEVAKIAEHMRWHLVGDLNDEESWRGFGQLYSDAIGQQDRIVELLRDIAEPAQAVY